MSITAPHLKETSNQSKPTLRPQHINLSSVMRPAILAAATLMGPVGVGCVDRGTPYDGPHDDLQPLRAHVESHRKSAADDINEAMKGLEAWEVVGHTITRTDDPKTANILVNVVKGDQCGKNPLGFTLVGLGGEINITACPDARSTLSISTLNGIVAHELGHTRAGGFGTSHIAFTCTKPTDPEQIHVDEAENINEDLRSSGVCDDHALMNPGGAVEVVTDIDAKGFFLLTEQNRYNLKSLVQPRGEQCLSGSSRYPAPVRFINAQGFVAPLGMPPKKVNGYFELSKPAHTIIVKPADSKSPDTASINILDLPPDTQCFTASCGLNPAGNLDNCTENCTGDSITPDAAGNCTLNGDKKGNAIVVSWSEPDPYPMQVCKPDQTLIPDWEKPLIEYGGSVESMDGVSHTSGGTALLLAGSQYAVFRSRHSEKVYFTGLPEGITCQTAVCDTFSKNLDSCYTQCDGSTLPLKPILPFQLNDQWVTGFRCELPENSPIGSGIVVMRAPNQLP